MKYCIKHDIDFTANECPACEHNANSLTQDERQLYRPAYQEALKEAKQTPLLLKSRALIYAEDEIRHLKGLVAHYMKREK